MKVAGADQNKPQPPSDEKIRMLADRAKKREPLFPDTLLPEDALEHGHYQKIREIHQAITFYLSFWKANEHIHDAEIVFTQIAKIICADPKRPARYAEQLPPPDSNPTIKTSKMVWQWHEVKTHVRRLMASTVIKTMAARL